MTNNDQEPKPGRWWLLIEVIIFLAFLVVITSSQQCSCHARSELHDR